MPYGNSGRLCNSLHSYLLLRRKKTLMLLQDIGVGHSGNVVANDLVKRLSTRLLLVGGRQLARKPHKKRKHFGYYLLRLLLVTLLRRTVIDILVKKFFDL